LFAFPGFPKRSCSALFTYLLLCTIGGGGVVSSITSSPLSVPFSCYHVILIKEDRTWEEALYYCRHHHHDLVTITNMDEQRWVQEKTKNASSPFVWTGLHYTCSLGFWFWVSDEVVHYKNWASPEQVNECDMSGLIQFSWLSRDRNFPYSVKFESHYHIS
uniref:C-type lectin domain-containing protein n=1 Tax=Oryzias latipes TaxID=8090 RepID=A0A3P9IC76_ORYLA